MVFWEFLRLLSQIDGGLMRAPETVALWTLLLALVSAQTLPPDRSPQKPEKRQPSKPGRKSAVSHHWCEALLVLVVLVVLGYRH